MDAKLEEILQVDFHAGGDVEVKESAGKWPELPKGDPLIFQNVNVPPEVTEFLRENYEQVIQSTAALLKALSLAGVGFDFWDPCDGVATVKITNLGGLSVEKFREVFLKALDE